jgi:FAD synthase
VNGDEFNGGVKMSEDLISILCERLTWVIRVGVFLITLLLGGYGYQATINISNAETIKATQATIETHIDAANQVHEALLNYWTKQ